MSVSRRMFLLGASGAAGALAFTRASALLERAAHAAPVQAAAVAGEYRAIVCVFLLGGNDANNMIIPNTDDGWAKYAKVRTAANIGIARDKLRLINPATMAAGAFGLHTNLPKLAGLFNNEKKLAIISNVGTLTKDTTKAEFTAGVHPEQLFSHSDQQIAWSTSVPDPLATGGGLNRTGWGGRAADFVASRNGTSKYPVSTFYGGRALFERGNTQAPFALPESGVLTLPNAGAQAVNDVRDAATKALLTGPNDSELVQSYRSIFGSALSAIAARQAAHDANPLPAAAEARFASLPDTTLTRQLHRIAEEIVASAASAAHGGLALKRQIFSAGLGGFDTHADELASHEDLYTELDDALNAFYRAIDDINALIAAGTMPGISKPVKVTLFTMSDFGRTFLPNADDGTDHAWGSHALVLGSEVAGGAMYGKFPDLTIGGVDDIGAEGRWLPKIATDAYANTLTRWLGVTVPEQIAQLYPKLPNFAVKRLGFLPPS